MPLSYSQKPASGSTSEFDVPFPYLDRAHVTVTVDNSPPVLPFKWISASRISLHSIPLEGQLVEIRRTTPLTSLVDYTAGATLTEEDLDTAYLHGLYIQQELDDRYNLYLGSTLQRLFDGNVVFETDPQAAMDQLTNLVLESAVLDNFRQHIADINLNAENIIATAAALTGVDTRVSGAETDLTTIDAARAALDTRVTTLRADHTSLTETVDALAGGDPGTGISTQIQNETNARIAGDEALAYDFSLLGARNGANNAFILNLDTVLVNPTQTLSQRIAALSAEDADARALIQSEETARIDAIAVEASRLDGLIVRADGIDASILTEQTARITGDTALSETISLMGAENGTGDAFILDLNTVKVSPTETLSQRLTQIDSSLGDNDAAILTETSARTTADAALASDISVLFTQSGDNASAIINEQNARATAISAEATARAQLAAIVDANESAIQSEATTRANADSAFTQNFTLLGAKNGAGTGWILDLNKVSVAEGTTLGTRLSGIDTSIGNVSSSVVNEQNARSSADAALANDISVVSTTANNNTASVSSLSSSVNGLQAKYGVSLDVNGYVTGFLQNNDGTSGSFTIVADKFAIVDPNAGSPFVPFEVIGGVTRIKDAVIGTLTVGKLTSGTLGATIGLDGDINVGTGRIVFDNGVTMKVMGIGFGTSNQFIEWVGPSRAISACNEASAIQYIKTDGSAYYGGTLSAGILTAKGETSLNTSSATIDVGPFETNGGTKNVVLSYSYNKRVEISNNASWSGSAAATVLVQRSLNGTSWTTIGTLNVNGTITSQNGFGAQEPGYIDVLMGGSITVSDNTAATSNMYLRGVITSRSLPTINSTVTGTIIDSQRVSVISTEE